MANNNTNWEELLEQYRNGTISDKNRFLLEKNALDDPFLFDALEGFSLAEDVNTVEESRSTSKPVSISNPSKKEKKSIFTIPRLAAAASLVFLVSMMFLLRGDNELSEGQTNQEIAMVHDEEKSDVAVEVKDKPSTFTESEIPDLSIETEEPSILPTSVKEKKVSNEEELVESVPVKSKREVKKEIINKTEEVIASNEEASFEKVSPSPSKIDYDTEGSEEMMADISSDAVKAAPKVKKKMAPSAYYVVSPEIGKTDFDEYVQNMIKSRSLKQSPSQTIVIEFSLDQNGMPYNFTHIVENAENDCPGCGAYAISLLKQSGVWKSAPGMSTSDRVRYKFEF